MNVPFPPALQTCFISTLASGLSFMSFGARCHVIVTEILPVVMTCAFVLEFEAITLPEHARCCALTLNGPAFHVVTTSDRFVILTVLVPVYV